MDYSIRPLTAADTAALADFYRSLRPETVYVFGPFQPVDEAVLVTFLAGSHQVSWGLVNAADEIEGHVFLRALNEPPPEFGIGLRERVHGQGWGRRMMAAAVDWADEHDLPTVRLSVFKINSRARALYESFGFVTLRDHTCHEPDDSLYCERQRPPR
ncbi:MAG: GNAT family N-acetyltransferase [Armatimonadetes bacterium]|nr:GNAT family N-acetyltransferase [Armatimonadota bacterium]